MSQDEYDWLFRRVHYSDADIDALIALLKTDGKRRVRVMVPDTETGNLVAKTMRLRDALAHLLESAAQVYEVRRQSKRKATSKQFIALAGDVASAARRLSATLRSLSDNDEFTAAMRRQARQHSLAAIAAERSARAKKGLRARRRLEPLPTIGASAFRQAVEGVANLEKWARDLVNGEQKELKPLKRHEGDVALRHWCQEAKGIYERLSKRSASAGDRSLFVKFLKIAAGPLRALGARALTENAARELAKETLRETRVKSKPKKF